MILISLVSSNHFLFSSSLHGWCGVCDPNAMKGQEGYCDQLETSFQQSWGVRSLNTDETLKEAVKTSPSSNWGWCSKECLLRHFGKLPTASNLQVANVNILKSSDCVRPVRFIHILRHISFSRKIRFHEKYFVLGTFG